MNYLLDTCLVSELVKKRPEPRVVDWVRRQPEDRLYLSVITLGEIQKGISKLKDESRAKLLQNWLDHDLLDRFAGRILHVTPAVARIWGQVLGEAEKSGRTLPVTDSLIASIALEFGATVVTRNVDDLAMAGVEILDPWPTSE